jgi:CrcB protein
MGGLDPPVVDLSEMPVFLFGGVGFCGAFTTFSSFCTETIALVSTSIQRALLYMAATVGGALVAFGLTFLALS